MKVVLVLLAVLFLAPLWFLFSGSFLATAVVLSMPPPLFPDNPVLVHYRWLFSAKDMLAWTGNTLAVTGAAVILSVAVSASAGYVFALHRFRGKETLWALILASLFLPRIALIIPSFSVVSRLSLSGSLWAVILPVLLVPSSVYVARTFFENVPRSLVDSARIDGASELDVLARIMVPVSGPLVASLALFAGIAAMSDWIWQALVLQDDDRKTLLVGLMMLAKTRGDGVQNMQAQVGRSLAAGVVLMVPLAVIFLAANRYFTQSLGGAVKE